ncbi:MAG: zinc ribbon domain-containing protein [Chloroflexota bacterium]
MKKFTAIVLGLLSIPFFVVGLLFLIAATQQASRGLVGLVLIALGTVLLVSATRALRRIAAQSPEVLKAGAIDLAKRLGGELTVAQLRAEYRIPQDLAKQVLDGLVREGNCAPEQREGRVVYVFSGLLPSLMQKQCPYCNTQLPVRSDLRKCPNCGAQLEISKT